MCIRIIKWLNQDSDHGLANSGALVPNSPVIFLSDEWIDRLMFMDAIKQIFIHFAFKPYFPTSMVIV